MLSNGRAWLNRFYHYIKRLILSGKLKGGEKIPEEKIAQQFGVSRTPIREALRRLEEYGLVYLKPRSYAEVISFSPKDAEQVACIRAQLEMLSARLWLNMERVRIFWLWINWLRIVMPCLRPAIWRQLEKDSQLHLEIARRTDIFIYTKFLKKSMQRFNYCVWYCICPLSISPCLSVSIKPLLMLCGSMTRIGRNINAQAYHGTITLLSSDNFLNNNVGKFFYCLVFWRRSLRNFSKRKDLSRNIKIFLKTLRR